MSPIEQATRKYVQTGPGAVGAREVGIQALSEFEREWLALAARLPGASLHVALSLSMLARAQNSRQVVVGNLATQRFGMRRNAKYRALTWLEDAGLIRVERRTGLAPLVTIVDASTVREG